MIRRELSRRIIFGRPGKEEGTRALEESELSLPSLDFCKCNGEEFGSILERFNILQFDSLTTT